MQYLLACKIKQTESCQSYYHQYNSYFHFQVKCDQNDIRYLLWILLLYTQTPSKGVNYYHHPQSVSQFIFIL